MRRLVVATVAAAVALTLVGCASAPPPAPAATTAPAAPAAAPVAAPVAAASAQDTGTLSSNEPTIFSAFPNSTSVPKEIQDRVDAKQPTLIYFYDGTQSTSKENRKIINSVLTTNRGLVDLVAYNLGKHVEGDAWSPVKTDDTFAKDANYQQAVALAQALGVTFTPSIVLTDNQGYIVWQFHGLVEKDLLEREILRASN